MGLTRMARIIKLVGFWIYLESNFNQMNRTAKYGMKDKEMFKMSAHFWSQQLEEQS